LEILLRLAFSNPKVEAIMMWGPSDIPSIGFERAETALFEGEDFIVSSNGDVFFILM
jgi:hypothetical protein